jgi:hypothetical protein
MHQVMMLWCLNQSIYEKKLKVWSQSEIHSEEVLNAIHSEEVLKLDKTKIKKLKSSHSKY